MIGDRLPGVGQADAAAEEQVAQPLEALVADRERAGVLEEEVALLREEQREAGEVHLLLVDFRLGEVGVDRDVEGEAGLEAVLHVEPDVADAARDEAAPGPVAASAADDRTA